MYKLSAKSKSRMAGVDPRLVEIAELAIGISTVDFGILESGGVRTAEQQNKLYMAGKSKADGYKNRSKHQDGKALDFYAYVAGQASWDKEQLTKVASAFKFAANHLGHSISWGGDWKSFPDYPHIQLEDV